MNKKIGVIGTGRLGGMLIRAMINQIGILPSQIYINNRSRQKINHLKDEFGDIALVESNKELLLKSDWIFLCVKPMDLPDLLKEIGTEFPKNKIIISTLVVPPLKELEKLIRGKLVRIYPGITHSTGHGVTLIAFGRETTMNEKQELTAFFSSLGKIYEVPEDHFRCYGDITSCGPAFMAYMTGTLAEIAAENNADAGIAVAMALETMLGTALFMEKQGLSFDQLVNEVAAPGGTTEEGIKVLKERLPQIIREVFEATRSKQQTVFTKVMGRLD